MVEPDVIPRNPLKVVKSIAMLFDSDFLEFIRGHPLPVSDRAKAVFHISVLNEPLPSPGSNLRSRGSHTSGRGLYVGITSSAHEQLTVIFIVLQI